MTALDWRIQVNIHDAGTTSPSLDNTYTTVDFTLQVETDIAELFSFGGQRIIPLEGKTISEAWTFVALDAAGSNTARLSDANGRMILLNRLVDVRVSEDAGVTYSTKAIGRLTDIATTPEVNSYRFTVQDERVLERNAEIWTDVALVPGSGDATKYVAPRLAPPGVDGDYGEHGIDVAQRFETTAIATDGDLVLVRLDDLWEGDWQRVAPWLYEADTRMIDLVEADMVESPVFSNTPSAGNFNRLRCRVNGTVREVYGFGIAYEDRPQTKDGLTRPLHLESQGRYAFKILAWVLWSGYASETITDAVLTFTSQEPTPSFPQLVGGDTGIHPFQVVKDWHDELGLRYDATALASIIADEFYGTRWWRIKGKAKAGRWFGERIYAPHMVVPFIDSQGRIAHKSIALPQDVDPSTLFEFNETNSVASYDWQHSAQEQVTRLNLHYTLEASIGTDVWDEGAEFPTGHIPELIGRFGLDLIKETTPDPAVFDHTEPAGADFAQREIDFQLDGLHTYGGVYRNPFTGDVTRFGVLKWGDFLSREVFDRVGDAPIWGALRLRGGTSSPPDAGDFVRVTRSAFPNPADQARGGTRIVQLMSAPRWTFSGTEWWLEYEFLDAGPNLQPTATPTVSAAQSVSTPKHAIDVTIGNAAGLNWQLEAKRDSGAYQPVLIGSGNGTFEVSPLPSGSTYTFRARTAMPGRIRSAWSTTASASTATLAAPTSLTSPAQTARTIDLDWAVGEAEYPLEILIDDAACAGATPAHLASVWRGATEYTVRRLVASTTYCIQVRHYDAYGGVGTAAQLEQATSATDPTLQAPSDIYILQGA